MEPASLAGATLGFARSRSRGSTELTVSLEGEEIGEVRLTEGRTVLELEGREWWSWWDGLRVVRGRVTDAERTPLALYAGTLLTGPVMERHGTLLTLRQVDRPSPVVRTDLIATETDVEALVAVPVRLPGGSGWEVRLTSASGLTSALPSLLALWSGLAVIRRRRWWLSFTTIGVSTARIERELEGLWRALM